VVGLYTGGAYIPGGGLIVGGLRYGIYRHLYLKQTRNALFEMHISSVVHIWSKKTKKYQCFPSFPLKTIRRYLINNKLNYNFQIFKKCMRLFCFYACHIIIAYDC
jgi:hypothetical protein